MRAYLGYRLRRAVTWIAGQRPCLAYRCGRAKIPSPSQFCRVHTDAVLYQRGDEGHDYPWRTEVAARLGQLSDERLAALGLEIEIGRDLAVLRGLR